MYLSIKSKHIKLVRCCPNVALLIPVPPHNPKHVGDQHVVPDVELSVVVQHWTIDVQLNNVSLVGSVLMLLLLVQHIVNLIELVNYCNPVPSIRKFPRLHDPNVPQLLPLLLRLIFLF